RLSQTADVRRLRADEKKHGKKTRSTAAPKYILPRIPVSNPVGSPPIELCTKSDRCIRLARTVGHSRHYLPGTKTPFGLFARCTSNCLSIRCRRRPGGGTDRLCRTPGVCRPAGHCRVPALLPYASVSGRRSAFSEF